MPPALTTLTPTVPVPAGEIAVICVALLTVTPVAAVVPNSTVLPEMKPVPVIVTLVAPPGGPVVGATTVTVGAAT